MLSLYADMAQGLSMTICMKLFALRDLQLFEVSPGICARATGSLYDCRYGGFNINLSPGFSPSRLCWMLGYGIYAVPNLR